MAIVVALLLLALLLRGEAALLRGLLGGLLGDAFLRLLLRCRPSFRGKTSGGAGSLSTALPRRRTTTSCASFFDLGREDGAAAPPTENRSHRTDVLHRPGGVRFDGHLVVGRGGATASTSSTSALIRLRTGSIGWRRLWRWWS